MKRLNGIEFNGFFLKYSLSPYQISHAHTQTGKKKTFRKYVKRSTHTKTFRIPGCYEHEPNSFPFVALLYYPLPMGLHCKESTFSHRITECSTMLVQTIYNNSSNFFRLDFGNINLICFSVWQFTSFT